jgi:hydroxymethylglutaryl-CoA reductase (NADPH)
MLTTIPDDHGVGFPSSTVDTMELLEPLIHDLDVPAMRPVPHGGRSSLEAVAERWLLLGSTQETREALGDARALSDVARYERNIENYIGTVKVPIGLAGPLQIRGDHAIGEYYLPLATTEAALVASYSRGAQLITEAGGCDAAILAEGVSRAPGFAFRSLRDATRFESWIGTQTERFAQVASATTRHGRLSGVRCTVEGNHVYVTFEFTTGEAAGQNMVTLATAAIVEAIARQSPVKSEYFFLEANHSGDKKASAQAFAHVRGKRVSAEVRIARELVTARLHTSPERMADYWRMAALGGVLSGTIGVQGHYANCLAALYIACGQDAACVAESAVGVTRMEVDEDGDLYACVTLPNIIAGAVGGGTALPSQSACMEIIRGCGPLDSRGFAELCAGLALAGELSIIGAMCSGDFARAHAELARGVARGGVENGHA